MQVTSAICLIHTYVFRLGQPARVTETVLEHTVDVLFLQRNKAIQDLEIKLAEHKENNNIDPELKELKKNEIKTLKKDITDHLSEADVILGTFLTCSGGK